MKKILFHSLTIPPDNVSTGMLVAEIADGFKELGVDVEILASSPQYNVENSQNLILEKYYTSSYKDINITKKIIHLIFQIHLKNEKNFISLFNNTARQCLNRNASC